MNRIAFPLSCALLLFNFHLRGEDLSYEIVHYNVANKEVVWGSTKAPVFKRRQEKFTKSKKTQSEERCKKNSSLQLRAAAFFHTSRRFREIYGNVNGSYQIEGSTRLYKQLDGWANFDWSSQHGKSIGFRDPTRVQIANTSFGIKYLFPFYQCYTAYIGGGPSLAIIWIKNRSFCHHERVSKLAVGGVLKGGIYYCINNYIFLDLFADYLFQPVHFKIYVDIGGVKTGLGLGVRF